MEAQWHKFKNFEQLSFTEQWTKKKIDTGVKSGSHGTTTKVVFYPRFAPFLHKLSNFPYTLALLNKILSKFEKFELLWMKRTVRNTYVLISGSDLEIWMELNNLNGIEFKNPTVPYSCSSFLIGWCLPHVAPTPLVQKSRKSTLKSGSHRKTILSFLFAFFTHVIKT